MSLSKKDLFAFKDPRIGVVDLPELGGSIHIAMLTVAEADRLRNLGDDSSANTEIVILGACDEGGTRMFTEADRVAVMKMPADIVRDMARAIMRHNGFGGGGDVAAEGPGGEESPKNA